VRGTCCRGPAFFKGNDGQRQCVPRTAHGAHSTGHAPRLELIADIKATAARGATDADLAPARQAHRRAHFFLDFVEAENSMGFHAPQEAMRLLGLSLDHTRRGQTALRR
jgi:hypothetical protein